MWWNMPMAAPLNLWSMYSPGSFLAMWNKVYKTWNIMRFQCKVMIIPRVRTLNITKKIKKNQSSYSLALIGLKTVHVVGASDAPRAQEFQQVDFHGGLDKYKIVLWHAEARIGKERLSKHGISVTSLIKHQMDCWQKPCGPGSAPTCAHRRAWTSQHWGTAPPPWTSQWDQIYLRKKAKVTYSRCLLYLFILNDV